MMNCAKVRDLLLTDYVDGRLSQGFVSRIDSHCVSCATCRALSEAVKKTSAGMRLSERFEAPAHVWQNISSVLAESDAARVGFIDTIIGKLRALLFAHKPAFAVTTMVTVILMGALTVKVPAYRNQRMVNAYLEEQAQMYLNSNGDEQFEESVSMGSGTGQFYL